MSNKFTKRAVAVVLLALMLVFSFGCGSPEKTGLVKVGISWCEDIDVDEYGEDLQAYIDAVEKAGGEPVLLPLIADEERAKNLLKTIDALIMTGGEDIDPVYYEEEPDPNLEEVNEERDVSDFLLLKVALESDFPVLAICRGCQLLNVITGGTLYQDIPTGYDTDILHRDVDEEDFEYHDILIAQGSILADMMGAGKLNVNSWHHQGIKDLGQDLIATANSDDGMIEAIEKQWAPFVIGVQFHPEWHVDDGDDEFLNIFTKLIEFAGNNR